MGICTLLYSVDLVEKCTWEVVKVTKVTELMTRVGGDLGPWDISNVGKGPKSWVGLDEPF